MWNVTGACLPPDEVVKELNSVSGRAPRGGGVVKEPDSVSDRAPRGGGVWHSRKIVKQP